MTSFLYLPIHLGIIKMKLLINYLTVCNCHGSLKSPNNIVPSSFFFQRYVIHCNTMKMEIQIGKE